MSEQWLEHSGLVLIIWLTGFKICPLTLCLQSWDVIRSDQSEARTSENTTSTPPLKTLKQRFQFRSSISLTLILSVVTHMPPCHRAQIESLWSLRLHHHHRRCCCCRRRLRHQLLFLPFLPRSHLEGPKVKTCEWHAVRNSHRKKQTARRQASTSHLLHHESLQHAAVHLLHIHANRHRHVCVLVHETQTKQGPAHKNSRTALHRYVQHHERETADGNTIVTRRDFTHKLNRHRARNQREGECDFSDFLDPQKNKQNKRDRPTL